MFYHTKRTDPNKFDDVLFYTDLECKLATKEHYEADSDNYYHWMIRTDIDHIDVKAGDSTGGPRITIGIVDGPGYRLSRRQKMLGAEMSESVFQFQVGLPNYATLLQCCGLAQITGLNVYTVRNSYTPILITAMLYYLASFQTALHSGRYPWNFIFLLSPYQKENHLLAELAKMSVPMGDTFANEYHGGAQLQMYRLPLLDYVKAYGYPKEDKTLFTTSRAKSFYIFRNKGRFTPAGQPYKSFDPVEGFTYVGPNISNEAVKQEEKKDVEHACNASVQATLLDIGGTGDSQPVVRAPRKRVPAYPRRALQSEHRPEPAEGHSYALPE